MARFWIWLLVFMFLPMTAAADKRKIIVNGQGLTNRIIFVLDVSGSMTNRLYPQDDRSPTKFNVEVREFRRVVEQLEDDGKIQCVAFGAFPLPWKETWLAMPDQDGVDAATSWLQDTFSTPGANSYYATMTSTTFTPIVSPCGIQAGTCIIPPLQWALAHQEPDLSILIITDADFNDASELDSIAKLNAARTWGPAPIAIIGIGMTDGEDFKTAKKIADMSHSYFVQIK